MEAQLLNRIVGTVGVMGIATGSLAHAPAATSPGAQLVPALLPPFFIGVVFILVLIALPVHGAGKARNEISAVEQKRPGKARDIALQDIERCRQLLAAPRHSSANSK